MKKDYSKIKNDVNQVRKVKQQKKHYSCAQGLAAAAVSFALGLAVILFAAAALTDRRPTINVYETSESRDGARRAEEIFLAKRIVNVLEPLVGKNKVKAEVSLDVDYDTVATSEEMYDPNGQVLRSYKAAQNFASEGEYALNKYNRLIVQNGGQIKQMSVLVLIEGVKKGDEYFAHSSNELNAYAALITPVIGFVAERGDRLQIENYRPQNSSSFVSANWGCLLGIIIILILLWLINKKPQEKTPNKKNQLPLWDKLEQSDGKSLAEFLRNENPAITAYVLGKLSPDTASSVLNALPMATAVDVLLAMSENAPITREVAKAIEQSLTNSLFQEKKRERQSVYKLFSLMNLTKQKQMLEVLEKQNSPLADKLRELMFNFEDFVNVSDKDIRRLFDDVEAERLAVALRGASEKLKQHLFANMSSAAAEYVQKQMNEMGPVRLIEVEKAQAEIICLAQSLASRGKISLDDTKSGGRH